METPYACVFDYGVIRGDCRTFFLKRLDFVVRHVDGHDTCTYRVEWKEK